MKKLLVILMALVLCLSIFAACKKEEEPAPAAPIVYDVNAAAEYVQTMYKDLNPVVNADFEVTSKVMVNDVLYTVEWTATEGVTIDKKNDNVFIVNINETTATEYTFKLTATVKAGDGTSAAKEFNFTVPEYKLLTFEQYMACKEGDLATIQGYVVAINSESKNNKYNHLFLADVEGKGGYYCYDLEKDPVADYGIEVGMLVEVSATVTPYSGMQETKGGTAKIISTEKKTVAVKDITDLFKNGGDLKNYVGLPVTIKGVEISSQALEKDTDQYLRFKLNGKTSYIRTYITDFPLTLPLTKEGDKVVSADKATIDAAHAEHFGWLADATGIMVMYSSEPYLIPMGTDCFKYIEKIVKTPEQKVTEALELVTLKNFISENTTLELPLASTAHSDVTFAWAVDKAGYTIGADGKIALTVSETPVTLKFTVTATCGTATATKEFTVKVALPNVTIAEALKMDDGSTVVLSGVITSIKSAWSTKYNNMDVYLTDATGTILLYRCALQVEVGDVVKLTGKVGSHKDAKQIAQGATVEKLTVSTVAEATAMQDGTEVVLKGTISEVKSGWSAQHKNMEAYLTDAADGKILLYRIGTEVKVGDEVYVFGKVGSYKGKKQIAQGCTAVIMTPPAAE